MTYDSWKTTPPDFFDDPDAPAECEGCGKQRKLQRCSDYSSRKVEWLCRECAGDGEPLDPYRDMDGPFAENE